MDQENEHEHEQIQTHEQPQAEQSLSVHPNSMIDFAEIARKQLLEYDDINDDDFLVEMDQEEPVLFQKQNPQKSYMKLHKSFVPIGPTYQAEIPLRVSATTYLNRNSQHLQKIAHLRVHDTTKTPGFYQYNKRFIDLMLGERTYEEVCMIEKKYHNFTPEFSFQAYLNEEKIRNFWQHQFMDKKERAMVKKKKKKRSKGSNQV